MIVEVDGSLALKIDGVKFRFDNEDEYLKIVMRLTDPNPEIDFPDDFVSLCEEIASENKDKAEAYSAFIKEYLSVREGIVADSQSSENNENVTEEAVVNSSIENT